MRISFAPFDADTAVFLSQMTGVEYRHVDFTRDKWLCVSGRRDDGTLMGCCLFEFVSWFEAYFSIAIADPRCISRRVMAAMFRAVFSQVVRVTAEIEPGNEHAIRLSKRMGFEIEGYKRLAIEGRRDAVLLGMTKDTCRYLRARPAAPQAAQHGDFHGQLSQSA